MGKSYWWQQNAITSVLLFLLVAGSSVVTNAAIGEPALVLTDTDAQVADDNMERAYDLAEQENMYVEDTYSVQSVIDADKKKAEEERKKAEEEAERKRKEESERVASQTGESGGRFRVGSNSDSDEEIIRKLNSYYSGTPMAGLGSATLDAGKASNINPYLIAAIADTESTRAMYTCNTNNCFGRKSGSGGWMSFGSLEEAISNEANYLAKNYVDVGLVSVEQIGNKYCVGGNWAYKVNAQIKRISNL